MNQHLETEQIIFATQNKAKVDRFNAILATLFSNSENIDLITPDKESISYPEEGQNEHVNAVNKAVTVFVEQGGIVPVIATDDGFRFVSLPDKSPGAEIKRSLGEGQSPEDIFDYYNSLAKENSDIKAVLLRTIALATAQGIYQTWVEIPCRLVAQDVRPDAISQNPLDKLLIPDGFDVPFSEMSLEQIALYDQQYTGVAIDNLFYNWQKVTNEGYVSTASMSIKSQEDEGVREIILPPGFRFAQQEDSKKIAEMSGALAKFYGGRQNGDWVMEKYGNLGIDETGFFSETKGLIVAGQIGDPTAMLAVIGKRGGSLKTNTLIVAEDSRGSGLGRKIKEVAIQFARAAEMRKVYCTTSIDNDNALGTNLALGYELEATFPDQYKLGSLEVILGLPLIDMTNNLTYSEDEGMLLQKQDSDQGFSLSIFDPEASDDNVTQQVASLFKRLQKWHDGVGEETTFTKNTFAGASRGVEDIDGKGKLITYTSNEGTVSGVAVLTAKKGEPGKASAGKLYPLFGTEESIISLVAENVIAAKQIGCTKLYTFAPVNDPLIHTVLKTAGFTAVKNPYKDENIIARINELGYEATEEMLGDDFARLRSPYKIGEDLVPYELFIN